MLTRRGATKINRSLMGGGAESHYPCLSFLDICSLPIHQIADKDSVLLMWVTMPMLPLAFDIFNAWGFKYKTCAFTWVKTTKTGAIYMGMGRHTRANAEVCLLATKGNGIARQSASVKNTHLFPRGKHSEKPQEFRKMIEELYGNLPRIELFAREKTPGWTSIGYDIDGKDIRESIELLAQKNTL